MNKTLIVVGVVVGILVLAGICLASVGVGYYNTFRGNANDAREKWSAVESQYQRRADLVSQALPTVIGAAQQELAVFKALRDQAAGLNQAFQPGAPELSQTETLKLIAGFEQALLDFKVYVADNPEIVSAELFHDFTVIVEGSENRINVARLEYNKSVTTYRNSVQFFPANILAAIFGFDADEFPYFEAQEGAEQAPAVVFPTPIP